MKEKPVPYLCGGIFLVMLTEAKGKSATRRQLRNGIKDRVSNRNMLEGLIQFLMPSFKQPSAGRTFDGDTTDYRACKVSYGINLPFDDDVEIKGFDNRVKNQYMTELKKMDEFVDEFLRTDSDERMQWLIRALLILIEKDQLIKLETTFFYLNAPVTKADLLSLDSYCLSSLLLAVWHFIITTRRDNESGRDTFEALHDRAVEMNAKWRFKKGFGSTYPRAFDFDLFGAAGVDASEQEEAKEIHNEPRVEVYEAPYTDPHTQKQVLAQFHVEAKDNGIAIGQVFGGLTIGKRGGKDE